MYHGQVITQVVDEVLALQGGNTTSWFPLELNVVGNSIQADRINRLLTKHSFLVLETTTRVFKAGYRAVEGQALFYR